MGIKKILPVLGLILLFLAADTSRGASRNPTSVARVNVESASIPLLRQSQNDFCSILDDRITSLTSIFDAAKAYYDAQSDDTARGYDQIICEDAYNIAYYLSVVVSHAQDYQYDHCGGDLSEQILYFRSDCD